MTEEEEALDSQIFEEEQDLFFDEDSEEEQEEELKESVQQESEESFRRRLAGPSTNKAGLGSVDKDKVNKIIYEASKGSAFFENEKKKDEMVTKRINAILKKYDTIKDQDLSFEKRIVDSMIQDLEARRDLTQCICHIDMDAFYASVEELENPELKTQPMAVGSMSMLCTSNYEARKYGVRSAMPGFIAIKLCPQLKMIPLNFAKYRAASSKVRAVFAKYDPRFLPLSLDEAYLNLTEYLKKEPDLTPDELVQQIRREIFESTQLTASAAKVCSDINKPNGQYYLPIDKTRVMEFVKKLKVRQIPGVGRVTERVLEALGVHTCNDIYAKRAILYKLLSPAHFQFLLKSCLGLGTTIFDTESERKSVGVERTFSPISDPNQLYQKLHELCQALERDVEKAGVMGRNVGIKLKFASFEMRIRSKTLPTYTWSAKDIEKIAKKLLAKEMPMNLRLMGVRLANLKPRGSEDESVLKYFSKAPLPEKVKDSSDSSIEIKDQEPSALVCPICNRALVMDIAQFNNHVDECLNKVEVKTILENEKRQYSPSSSRSSSHSSNKRIKRSNSTNCKQNSKSLFDYYPSST
ncbi:IMS-domain-containing protein [Rhizopus microsporus var. microsporus]|uniref:DNA polymerase kappa n=1 Tax=Rhizopus microsporus var. microsporus TaxID=86635 RepID=A0A1X0RF38_RHIZD|nr:IMS-domain-containing protein [Rhizopus microsporus var. microsporus]